MSFDSDRARRTAIRADRGFQLTGLGLVIAVIALGLAFTLIWLGAGVYGTRQIRQAARQVDAIRAQTTAQLAFHAAEMVTFSAQVQAVRDEVRQALGAARDQDEARTREGSVLKGDLQRFSDWVEAGQARQARALLELQTRIEELQSQQVRDSRLWEAWRTENAAAVPVESARPRAETGPTATPSLARAAEPKIERVSATPSTTPARVTLTLPGGDRYSGGLRDGLFDGDGDLQYANGNRYVGTFRLGRKQGSGTFKFANGDVYVGEFAQDQRQGRGVYTYRDGSRYEGEFRNGLRHGKGRYTYAKGGEYVGEFKEGKKSGRGTHLFPDGSTMEGYWREDRFLGATP